MIIYNQLEHIFPVNLGWFLYIYVVILMNIHLPNFFTFHDPVCWFLLDKIATSLTD